MAGLLYWAGRKLSAYSAPGSGKWSTAAQVVVCPIMFGIVVLSLVLAPVPPWYLADIISTSTLWTFAAIGAAIQSSDVHRKIVGSAWVEGALALDIVATFRRLTTGVPL